MFFRPPASWLLICGKVAGGGGGGAAFGGFKKNRKQRLFCLLTADMAGKGGWAVLRAGQTPHVFWGHSLPMTPGQHIQGVAEDEEVLGPLLS